MSVCVPNHKNKSVVLHLIDFIDEMVSQKEKKRENIAVTVAYLVFLACCNPLFRGFKARDYSVIVTFAGMSQTLAFFMLLLKMKVQKSAEGVSSKMLQMYVLMFACRLASTCVKNGYLPTGASGNGQYQASDIASLGLVLQALFMLHKRYGSSYQAELDTLPIRNLLGPLLVLAYFCRGDFNRSPVFDYFWAVSMNLDAFAMLPQLWMFVAKGGAVEKMATNFVALMFFSRCLTWSFWYWGFKELICTRGGFMYFNWYLMSMHTLQLLLSADFMYEFTLNFFGKKRIRGQNAVVLPIGVKHDV